jgi:hypothetical protein
MTRRWSGPRRRYSSRAGERHVGGSHAAMTAENDMLDWSRIPRSLAFIIEPAERYGHIQFDEQATRWSPGSRNRIWWSILWLIASSI